MSEIMTEDDMDRMEDNIQRTEDNRDRMEDNIHSSEDDVDRMEDNIHRTEDRSSLTSVEKASGRPRR